MYGGRSTFLVASTDGMLRFHRTPHSGEQYRWTDRLGAKLWPHRSHTWSARGCRPFRPQCVSNVAAQLGQTIPKVLQPVVVRDAVDVIQDHPQLVPSPPAVLPAQLANGLLEAGFVKAPLELHPREIGALHQNLGERASTREARPTRRGVRVEVVVGEIPYLSRTCVARGGHHRCGTSETAQCSAQLRDRRNRYLSFPFE